MLLLVMKENFTHCHPNIGPFLVHHKNMQYIRKIKSIANLMKLKILKFESFTWKKVLFIPKSLPGNGALTSHTGINRDSK